MRIIGVLHLLPLPGSPLYLSFEEVMDVALRDAKSLVEGGVDAIIVENYGDMPFLPEVGKETVAAMTAIALEVKREIGIPIGINVLRNDAIAALAIAKAVKADFIRVNQLFFSSLMPEGWADGKAGEVMRYRKAIDCKAKVFADVSVKHAFHFVSIEDYMENVGRSLADAVIVTGSATGKPVNVEELAKVKKLSPVPVYAGSGITPENVAEVMKYADGVIVGTYFKKDGRVDVERVKRLVRAASRV
ncbi:BtpA/SgcQ family protein [Archaeoglobus veneficus]|uniref:Photosystem I assembly BtpA n=1 Tax=Archaeoglobus veneficus (strain DSM 11195 / SNP6) TaxID=693661 RepID=F2KQJ1_ARCVS|nr:BtpA/SgcQ family protein [Archaeoglobus veneficus]AEA47724.1 photosystem I assembly BtpA [Archaeoglobus veneficus SNP6]